MADFLTAYKLTVGAEGLYSNDEGDSGGETVLGLTRAADGDWAGWHVVDDQKKKIPNPNPTVKQIEYVLQLIYSTLDALAQPYYKKKYWDKVRGDEIHNQIEGNRIFDTYVNTGTAGVTLAQRALGIAESGHMDNLTLNTLNNMA